MGARTALVVGGTGPTGPPAVNGLLERGYEVTVFHSGLHEAEFAGPVRHIHGDVHFPETIREACGDESFDLVIAQYGRLRHLADHFAGRTEHFIGVGSGGSIAGSDDPRWGGIGRPVVLFDEHRQITENDPARNKLGFRMGEALQNLMQHHEDGHYVATYIGYPILYGPRQPGAREWAIIRRALDGRRRIIVPEGGQKLIGRGYNENVARAPLFAADQPELAAGKSYVVSDLDFHTFSQRIAFIGQMLGHEFEIVSMPFDIALPGHPLYEHRLEQRVFIDHTIRADLGYTDLYSSDEALTKTVEWYLANRPEPGGELEQQLGDPFDYAREDAIMQIMDDARARIIDVGF
ncbi:MAG TPA: hypothetical protein VMM60_16025, partial [Ilumatobacter sp.]|nr:hypothetical protein [Ilumatobacter sp.]